MGLRNEFELPLWQEKKLILGLDEAGRGPMAGPLVVSGVILPVGYDHPLIDDSKKLTDTKRRAVFDDIKDNALFYEIVYVDVKTIDQLNIYQATKQAMEHIINMVPKHIEVLTDAMPVSMPHQSLIKGDQRSLSIAAASILAKVSRDDIMLELDALYPEYGFKDHKGYGTKKHKEAMLAHGRTPEHRASFKFKEQTS